MAEIGIGKPVLDDRAAMVMNVRPYYWLLLVLAGFVALLQGCYANSDSAVGDPHDLSGPVAVLAIATPVSQMMASNRRCASRFEYPAGRRLQEVIDELGPPKKVEHFYRGSPHGTYALGAWLLYPEKGLRLAIDHTEDAQLQPCTLLR